MINNNVFRRDKNGRLLKRAFCANPELIENYDLAMADKDHCWECHHKLEAFYTRPELIGMGRYFHCEPRELVFTLQRKALDSKCHYFWPHKGRLNLNNAEARRKNSESNKGKKRSEACKQKHREQALGNTNLLGKHWKLVEGKRCYY